MSVQTRKQATRTQPKKKRTARRAAPAFRMPRSRPLKPVLFMRCRVNLVSPEAELVTLCEPISGREVVLPLSTTKKDGGAVLDLGLKTGQEVVLYLHT